MRHFIIISPARSGSTSLRETLNAHSEIVCHGEVFASGKVYGLSRKTISKDIEINVRQRNLAKDTFIRQLFPEDGPPVGGAKMLYQHLYEVENLHFLNWLSQRKPGVIFLWRRNLIQRYKSELLLRSMNASSTQKIQAIEPRVVINDCRTIINMAQFIPRLLFRSGRYPVHAVDFEDLISKPQELAKIMTYLGVANETNQMSKDKRSAKAKRMPIEDYLDDFLAKPIFDRFRDVDRPVFKSIES